MKYKSLFLLLISVVLAGMGTARAQCAEVLLGFPTSGPPVPVPSGTCLAAPNQQARLRWDNANSGKLQLFDTDDQGQQIWCAGGDTGGGCVVGQSFCLRQDGNAVIFDGPSCTGNALWRSGTSGQNICGEGIGVGVFSNGGEKAVIVNNINCPTRVVIWSRGADSE